MHGSRSRRRSTGGRAARCSPLRGAVLTLLVTVSILLLGATAAWAATVTCTLTPGALVYGNDTVIAGTVDPAVAGQQVSLALDGAEIATATTNAAGEFTVTFTPRRGGVVTATLVGDGSVSAPVTLTVRPKVTTSHATPVVPFTRNRLVVHVTPASLGGRVVMRVYHHSRQIGGGAAAISDGRAVLKPNLKGVGRFVVKLQVQPADGSGFSGRSLNVIYNVAGKRLAVGSRGPWVRALLSRLVYLRIRTPGTSSTLSTYAGDSVVAFQKAYRLPRTYVFDGDDWRKLDTAKRIKPRLATRALHIEIDKTRQILCVVRNGGVVGILPISSGATNNTPEGSFHILWKALATGTPYGGTLLRTMTFHDNFAIHGYAPVPPYPASHGCVREPYWVCNWTYVNSYVGELVYIYH